MTSNKLIDYFSEIMPLTDEEIGAITKSMCVTRFKKGDVLLREGQIATDCYFVLEGCLRQYYLGNGEEKTSNFFTEGQWVVFLDSFMNQTPVDHFLVCCEDTEVVIGNEQKENDLYSRFSRLETISRKVMEKILAEQQQASAAYFTDSPEQRYLRILTTRPDLFQRIPQYQLASYIGVKPESLSRIRKRIATRALASGTALYK